jgi:fucose 4-O-acetylase-like acetyltransferase
MSNTPRLVSIDYLKSFAIFCVILGHSIQNVSSTTVLNPLHDAIYSFHMPLFMIASGFFLSKSFKADTIEFTRKRVRQLLLPVLSFSITAFLFSKLTQIDLMNNQDFLSYLGGGDMWFLKYLFVCSIIVTLSKFIFRNTLFAALLPTIILIALTRNNIFRLLPFLWTGVIIYHYRDFIHKHSNIISTASFITWVVCLSIWKMDYDAPHYQWITIHNNIIFNWLDLIIILYRLLIGLAGSLFFIALFSKLQRLPDSKLGQVIVQSGRHTLGIYCLQIYLLEALFSHITLPPCHPILNITIVIFVAIIEFFICNCIVSLIEKNKWSNLLYLGTKS